MTLPQAGLGAAVVIVVLAVGLALLGVAIPPPPEWLTSWTEWVAEVVAIIVAAKVFWEGAKYIARLHKKAD